ncbi:OLC1v1012593C1 [Oldenlandia corymbosa var. corymbosa]|uniref:OLC1v1012593C1 n=1 Tax=Oldenlandia corymbosa var. corymbosa TaxID=529605 RepID=A0AAV1DY61_OLDCO|nr:OLC1v1012593C1 [Oldenlandia corymbosa var. corymbosa]
MIDYLHVLIYFELEEDNQRCWMKGWWNFENHVMRVLKWTTSFNPNFESSIVPVWVSFGGMPVHRFNEEYLRKLAGIIGKPLKIDVPTLNMSRPLVARVCMEVDLLKDLPKRIHLGVEGNTYFEAVPYENLPEYCMECSKIGHSVKNCKHTKEWKSKVDDTTEAGNQKQTANSKNLVVKTSIEKLQIMPKEAPNQTKHVWKAKPLVLHENEMEKTKDHHGPSTSGLSHEEKQSTLVDVMERSPLIQIQSSGKRKLTKERLVSIIQENDKEPSLLDSWDIVELKKFAVLADLDNPVTGDTEVDAKLQEDIDSEILVSMDDSEIGGSSDFVPTEEARVSASDGEQRKKKRGHPKGSKNGVNNNGNEGETRRSAKLQGGIPPNV